MQAVFPVPGLPEMYMLPGFLLSMAGCKKLAMEASSLSLQKMVAGVEVCKAWRALVKLLTATQNNYLSKTMALE